MPVSWDIGIPEWGVITGFDDEKKEYAALSAMGKSAPLALETLGDHASLRGAADSYASMEAGEAEREAVAALKTFIAC